MLAASSAARETLIGREGGTCEPRRDQHIPGDSVLTKDIIVHRADGGKLIYS